MVEFPPFYPSTVITSLSIVSKGIFRNCTNRMYVIYWQNSPVNPSVISDSKWNGPNPGLGYIRLQWLWILYFRNDRLMKTCFACEKWNPTEPWVPWCLESFIFPFSPRVKVSSLFLKVLQRIQKETRECPATHSVACPWVCLYTKWLGKFHPQLAFSRTLGCQTREWEEVFLPHFVTWSHLE